MANKYIVVFKKDTSADTIKNHESEIKKCGGEVHDSYDSVLKGFSAVIPDSYLLQLQSLQGGEIDYIEADGVVTTQ
ncbi:serine proteinase inhibitor IA-1 [Auriscalpium vulgare]|uniref:Serine proteinase inhibitor IA-1 n=1 Tax=Auriscalpium vulgare TaxID=40419 RepID=A0ACB8S700_9AGAM|nr:serine proteinase inhibitor IA-1 [Auriscalpium vulgare]